MSAPLGVRIAPLRPGLPVLPTMERFRRSPLVDIGGEEIVPPRTTVTLAWTLESFFALFQTSCEPPLVVGCLAGGPVFEDECVELFLADPDAPTTYVEIVANPAGTLYGARVENPGDSRETWRLSAGVVPPGTCATVFGEPEGTPATEWTSWRCLLEVPWRSFAGGAPPRHGEMRRGNAARIARGRATRFEALTPTFRVSPPDFHVPSRFAYFVFG